MTSQPVELGTKFQANQAGEITELKYYRAVADADDTDVREGHLWNTSGDLLATVTFTSVSGDDGWQVAKLSAPLAIAANTIYVVSYTTCDNYFAQSNFFDAAFTDPSGILSSPAGEDGNGVFGYGSAIVYPTSTFQNTNYWVDLTFDPTAVNDAPVLTGDLTAMVTEGGSYTLAAADLGFCDPDDAPADVTFTVANLTAGTLLVDGAAATNFTGTQLAGGLVSFVHDGSETLAASFGVSVEDGNEDVSAPVAQTFTLNVTSVNDAPTIGDIPNQAIDEDETVTATADEVQQLIAQLTEDVDGDAVTVTLTLTYPDSSTQTITVDPNAPFSFTPPANFHGTITVVATASDGNGGTASDSFNLVVNPVNDAPTIADIPNQAIDEDATVTATAAEVQQLIADLTDDVDGDAVTVTLTLTYPDSSTQTITVDPNAPFSFTPPANFHGTIAVVATASDGNGGTASDSFNLVVNPVNDAPTIADIPNQAIDEDETVTATADEVQQLIAHLTDDVDGDAAT